MKAGMQIFAPDSQSCLLKPARIWASSRIATALDISHAPLSLDGSMAIRSVSAARVMSSNPGSIRPGLLTAKTSEEQDMAMLTAAKRPAVGGGPSPQDTRIIRCSVDAAEDRRLAHVQATFILGTVSPGPWSLKACANRQDSGDCGILDEDAGFDGRIHIW